MFGRKFFLVPATIWVVSSACFFPATLAGQAIATDSDPGDEALKKLDELNRKADETLKRAEENARKVEGTFGEDVRKRDERLRIAVGKLADRSLEQLRAMAEDLDSKILEARQALEELGDEEPENTSEVRREEAIQLSADLNLLTEEREAVELAIQARSPMAPPPSSP